MRLLFPAVALFLICSSCNKNKYTSAPQIKFKSIDQVLYSNTLIVPGQGPKLVITLTDAEGDFGFKEGKDTSLVFIKNITVPPFKMDSFKFPAALAKVAGKNFKGDVQIDLTSNGIGGNGVLDRTCASGCTDSLYFEVYVKDFAKNKSNVIKTAKPLLFISP